MPLAKRPAKHLQDSDDFDIATVLFWSYYFVYQRGEDKKRRDELFKEFIRPLIPSTAWKDIWEERFHFLHNSLLHEMASRIDTFVKDWIESPAGDAFTTEIRFAA